MSVNYNNILYRKPKLGIFLLILLGLSFLGGAIWGISDVVNDIRLLNSSRTMMGQVTGVKYSLAIINTATIEFFYEKKVRHLEYRYLVLTDIINKGDLIELKISDSDPAFFGVKFRFHSRIPFILFFVGFTLFGSFYFAIYGTRKIILYHREKKKDNTQSFT